MAQNYKTIEQQIAAKEAELARLKDKQRKLENGQKIILGGFLLNEAKADTKIRSWLLHRVAKTITRDIDKKRLAPLLKELQAMGTTIPTSSNSSHKATEKKT